MHLASRAAVATFRVRRSLNILLLGAALVPVGFVWWSAIHTIVTDTPPPPVLAQPRALAWGDRVFTNPGQLEAWLRQRGIAYDVWARRHKSAAAIVEHRAVSVPAVRSAPATPARASAPASKRRPHRATPTTASFKSSAVVGIAAWILVSLLAVAAFAPRRWYFRISPEIVGDCRTAAAAAAGAVALGAIAAGIQI